METIFVLIGFALIAFFQIPGLVKKKEWRELVIFSIFLFVGFSLNLLMSFGIKLPSPAEGYKAFFGCHWIAFLIGFFREEGCNMFNINTDMKRSQFMLLLAGFIQGSYLLISFVTNQAEHDVWIVILSGFAAGIPLLLCFIALSKKFPDKNLVEILKTVYGDILGVVISVLYVLFFLILASFNLRDISSFYIGYVLTETPPFIIVIIFVLVGAVFSVGRGILAISRVSLITVTICLLTSITLTLIITDKMDFSNFLPVFDIPIHTYLQATYVLLCLPLGETVAFLMIAPMVKDKTKLTRYVFGGMGLAIVFYLLPTIRNTAVLGTSNIVYSQATYQSARMISIADFITRIDLFVTFAITMAIFIKISVLFFAATKGISQLLHLKSNKLLLLPVGSIVLALSMASFSSSVFHSVWGINYGVWFNTPFVILIPVITLIVAKLRKFKTPMPVISEQQNII